MLVFRCCVPVWVTMRDSLPAIWLAAKGVALSAVDVGMQDEVVAIDIDGFPVFGLDFYIGHDVMSTEIVAD